uniref:Retrotransposon gag domain-containing protein n=1 Tax=Tanacetum cinerariifolium TaxID=118510 RepID=A0A699HV79_TANCI|nr:hypothetical protein [Tanacetum cinerariifolium]
MKKTRILTRLYDVTPTIVLRRNIFKARNLTPTRLRRNHTQGTDDEDAYKHVRMVLEIVDLFHFLGVTHETVMLKVFSITLKGQALRWKKRLPARMINTWDLLKKEFIWQYCSPFKFAKKLEEIYTFKQEMRKVQGKNDNGKENMKEPVPRDLPPAPFLGHLKEQICGPYRTHKTIYMIENLGELHKLKDQEDEGDMHVGWDVTIKDVERLRQFLTTTIHTLPNRKPVVQPYMSLGPVHDKEKSIREKEHDYDIPLHDGVMQPLAPQTVHIIPPDDDYVAPPTNPNLDKQLNKFRKEIYDITKVAKMANCNPINDVKELSDINKYDCETFI